MTKTDDERAAGKAAWYASMSVALGLGLGFFVLTTVAGVLGVGLVVGYQNTVDLLAQKAELIVSSQREQTVRFFESAENQVDYIAERIAREEIEPDGSDEFVSLLVGAVSATPQIVRIQFIGADYRLTGVERQEDEAVPMFQRVGDDHDLRRLVDEARQAAKPHWGEVLWRSEYGQGVLNYRHPVSRDGTFLGVMSAWISTDKMSEFLADLQIELGANAFILHGRDQVFAHPLMAFGYAGVSRSSPLPRQSGFSDPVVASMWDEAEGFIVARQFLSGRQVRFVSFGDLSYIVLYRQLDGYAAQPLLIGTYFESHDMIAEVGRLKWAIVFCAVMAVLSAGTAAYIGHKIAQPVRRLAAAARRVRQLDLADTGRIPNSFFSELNDAAQSFNAMLDGLRWFERYVPKQLVGRLMRQDADGEVATTHREVAVLFTDVVGFTAASEHLSAAETADFLNRHFAMVARCVEAEDGIVDKFIGDSVMALWGAHEAQDELADRACRAALAIAEGVDAANRKAGAGGIAVRLRIGIHVGRVVVGNIGSADRVNYTVVGDAVNVAQRLEEIGKTLGDAERAVNIVISAAVRAGLGEGYRLRPHGPQALRGRGEPVEIYMLLGAG